LTLAEYPEALAALERAQARDAADPAIRYLAFFSAGRALEALNRPEEAMARYAKALEIVPGAESAALALATLQFVRDDVIPYGLVNGQYAVLESLNLIGMKRRKFTKQFKREAVQLLRTSGKNQTQMARELGVATSVLGAWIAMVQAEEKTGLTPDELEELKRLRKDNARLQMEVEILGKATAFFANRSK